MSSVCRVCRAGDLQLKSLKNKELIHIYEKLLVVKFNSGDAKPRDLCCFCSQKLLKCHIFFQMALRSENIFNQLFHQGLEATLENITKLNLGMEQQLSVNTKQSIMINSVTHHDKPISVKVEVTSEGEQLVEVKYPSHEGTKSKMQDIPISVKEEVHQDNPIPVKEEVTIEEEPLFEVEYPTHEDTKSKIQDNPISVKEEVITEEELSVEVEYHSHEGTKCQLASEDNDSETEGKELLPNIQVERSIPDSKMISHCNHCNSTHTKQYSCNVCNKKFTINGSLVRHMRIHAGEQPFACSVCNRRFSAENSLVVHMRTHTGEKPFACSICNKNFITKSNLVRHIRTHTGEKPFACSVCNKQFSVQNSLVRHMKTHTGV